MGVYKTWWECDAALLEINPLCIVLTKEGNHALSAVDRGSGVAELGCSGGASLPPFPSFPPGGGVLVIRRGAVLSVGGTLGKATPGLELLGVRVRHRAVNGLLIPHSERGVMTTQL